MIAIEIAGFGGPEVLRPVERPVPEPGLNEVRVRVHAAGVNRPDLMQRQGKYPPPPGASDIPGLELAGIVESVGPVLEGEPSRWAPGDRVCALVAGGGYAEYAVAPSPQCLPVPAGMTLVSAAAIPETVLHRLDERLSTRAARDRRNHPRARRLERHRHDRDSARQGIRRDGLRHRRHRREMPRVRTARRARRHQLQERRISSTPSRS